MMHARVATVSLFVVAPLLITASSFSAFAQQVTSISTVVPTLVSFSGVLTEGNGKPMTSITGVTFSLYTEQQGGAPLWLETQNVQPDKNGQYTVMLGSTTSQGLPSSVFASGQARWLGVQAQGQEEQPRIMLLSVPYALKAGDAQTLGGQPASAFATASAGNAAGANGAVNNAITGGGTTDYVPLWLSKSKLGSSKIFQSTAGDLGIGTTSPSANLDVSGTSDIRNTLTLFPNGSAPTLSINGTAFQVSSTGTVTFVSGQTFPGTGTVTSVGSGAGLTGGPITKSGTLSIASGGVTNAMLANSSLTVNPGGGMSGGGRISLGGSATLGLENCSANQVLEYISGAWTCTNAGTGTITGVTAGTGLSGGGSSGNVTLNNTGILSLTQGTGISISSGQTPTIGINTSVVPRLNTANTFTGNQTVNGNLSATGLVSSTGFEIGSNLFDYGSDNNANALLGFAGNTTMTGYGNTASGLQALYSNTTGNYNTASGSLALYYNSTGSSNTASGYNALGSNTASGNTATGVQALAYNTTGSPNDAFGYQALYSNTEGGANEAFGSQALYSNTMGSFNQAFGYLALYSNVGDSYGDGEYNTAVGYLALASNNDTSDTGAYANFNVAVGSQALGLNTTGYNNTGVGATALGSNNTGGENTAVGYDALFNNTTGGGNTAVGFNALLNNYTGNDLTCIGIYCTADEDGLRNATAIGAHAVVSASNALVLGGTGKWAVKVGIGTTKPTNILTIARGAGHPVSDSWETYSSRRWKTNIQTLPDALSKVEQLRGVSYDLKDSGKHEIGVIAEEVGAVVPEVVTYEDNGKDARGVDYSRLTALLIEATKQQQALIRKQQEQIRAQQAQMRLQQGQIARLSLQVKAIQASLKTSGHTGSEVRTVKAQAPIVQQ